MSEANIVLAFILSAFAGFLVMAGRAAVVKVCLFIVPWYGPIGITFPANFAAKLFFNIVLIGMVLQHEKFDKNAQVGTALIVLAVVNLSIVGLGPQETRDVTKLILENNIAIVWLSIITVLYIVCVCSMFLNLKKRTPFVREAILLFVVASSAVLSSTASKAANALDEGPYKVTLFVISILILLMWLVEGYLEPSHVRSMANFIPQTMFTSLNLNAVTGMIVWEEYSSIVSWTGYIVSYLLMGLGIYLMSDADFFFKQGTELEDEQAPTLKPEHFVSDLEDGLSLAQLKRTLSIHQLKILNISIPLEDCKSNLRRHSLSDTQDYSNYNVGKFLRRSICNMTASLLVPADSDKEQDPKNKNVSTSGVIDGSIPESTESESTESESADSTSWVPDDNISECTKSESTDSESTDSDIVEALEEPEFHC